MRIPPHVHTSTYAHSHIHTYTSKVYRSVMKERISIDQVHMRMDMSMCVPSMHTIPILAQVLQISWKAYVHVYRCIRRSRWRPRLQPPPSYSFVSLQ